MHRIFALTGQDILATGHVKRWHMVRTKRTQTLAEHNAIVALLAVKIAQRWAHAPTPTELASILSYALTHDSHEVEYGDPPSPAVDVAPEAHAASERQFWAERIDWSPPISDMTRTIVKIADKLEALLFYMLEGEDPRLKTKGVDKMCTLLASVGAPSAVTLWIDSLVQSVKDGTFTPQPGGRRFDAL